MYHVIETVIFLHFTGLLIIFRDGLIGSCNVVLYGVFLVNTLPETTQANPALLNTKIYSKCLGPGMITLVSGVGGITTVQCSERIMNDDDVSLINLKCFPNFVSLKKGLFKHLCFTNQSCCYTLNLKNFR